MFLVTTAVAICWTSPQDTCYTAGDVLQNGDSLDCYGQQYYLWTTYVDDTLTGTKCADGSGSGAWDCEDGTQQYMGVKIHKVTRICSRLGIGTSAPIPDQATLTCDKASLGEPYCTTE